MVSNKQGKRQKKPLETTLGKAVQSKNKEPDMSHVQKPIETSITGIKQLLSLLETATNEVKNIVMFECDIMYECRICRTIFRSLANFILHKRNYCTEIFNPLYFMDNNDCYQENIYDVPKKENISKGISGTLNKVIEKLHHLEQVRQDAKKVLQEDLSSDQNQDALENINNSEESTSNSNDIILEKISTNNSGVFQTLVSNSRNKTNESVENHNGYTKLEVMEIHKKIEFDIPILDSEGKISGYTNNEKHDPLIFPKSPFCCTECKQRFASKKSLNNHIKSVHNPTRILYVCPTCKETFANQWSVYRHLLKVHRMTNKQVRRMREQVHNSWIRRGDEHPVEKKKINDAVREEAATENQWINDLEEDNDFQMCAGCGKHFERKAALHSHSQICVKRLEVCNSIKDSARKKEEEAVQKAKMKINCDRTTFKGALKRKSNLILNYGRGSKESESSQNNNKSGIETYKEMPGKSQNVKPEGKSTEVPDEKSPEMDVNKNNKVANIPPFFSTVVASTDSDIMDSSNLNVNLDKDVNELSKEDKNSLLLSSSNTINTSGIIDEFNFTAIKPEMVDPVAEKSDTNLLSNNHDLLSNEISIKVVCTKVEDRVENKNILEEKISPRVLRKRKKLSISADDKNDFVIDNSDDDVIFVGETFGFSNRTAILKDGFAGFTNKESTQVTYSIDDLSNLSYNNPLKCNQKNAPSNITNKESKNAKCLRRKSRAESIDIDKKIIVFQKNKNEANFIAKAAPYMNQKRLLCVPCDLTFKSLNFLLWHMSAHFSWFRYQCSKCSFINYNKYDCILHARKEHKLKENAANYILPLPNWKTVLMAHEFRPVKDCHNLKGKHTDENITFDDAPKEDIDVKIETLESDALFGECPKILEDNGYVQTDCVKKRTRSGKSVIDIEETMEDFQKLPEPTELTMPVNVSEIIRTSSPEQNNFVPDEEALKTDHFCEDSNDDWELPETVSIRRASLSIKKGDETKGAVNDDFILSSRPLRIRTKPKKNDFVYYDKEVNQAFKSTNFMTESLQKNQGNISLKTKVPGKPDSPKKK